MTNIWSFAVQTAEVSVMAAIILLLKTIMKDKLSPRWQYGVWLCLGRRILIPVGSGNRYIFRYIQVYLQACKTLAEQKLHSAFTDAGKVVHSTSIFPALTGKPCTIIQYEQRSLYTCIEKYNHSDIHNSICGKQCRRSPICNNSCRCGKYSDETGTDCSSAGPQQRCRAERYENAIKNTEWFFPIPYIFLSYYFSA